MCLNQNYHIIMLLDANLVLKERQGKWNYYSINISELENFLSKELILKIFKKIYLNTSIFFDTILINISKKVDVL